MYQKLRVEEERRALQDLGDDEAIAIAEALLTSSLNTHHRRDHDPRPLNLLRCLRIHPNRVLSAPRSSAP